MSKPLADAQSPEPLSQAEEPASLDAVLDRVAMPEELASLPSGRRIFATAEGEDETLVVTSEAGRIELSIRLTPMGPVLSLEAVTLALRAKDIDLRCERLRIDAEERVETRCKGDIVSIAKGTLRQRAFDDLSIDGKNVLINC